MSTNYTTMSDEMTEVYATSCAAAEIHAASDAVKEGLHIKYIANELEIKVNRKLRIGDLIWS